MQRYCAQYGCTGLREPLPSDIVRTLRRRERLAHARERARPRPPAPVAPARGPAPRRAVDRDRPRHPPRHQLRRHGTTCARLESVGLVHDTGEGEGKRRLWRASSEYHSWHPSDFEGDEDSETALNWLTRDYARHFSEQYDKWLDVSTTWPTAWQDACGSSDAAVLVTAESLEAMREEMWDLIERYRRVGQGNPQARRIAVYAFAYPLDLDRPPTTTKE